MKLIWKKYQEYFAFIGFCAIAFGVIWFGIMPMHRKIQERMTNVQELLTEREINRETLSRLPELRDQVEHIRSKEKALDIVIPRQHIVDLIKKIEALAEETKNVIVIESKDSNLVISGVATQVSSEKKKDKKSESSLRNDLPSDQYVEISITVTGDYQNIVQLLRKLETMPYAIDILSLDIGLEPADQKVASGGGNPFASDALTPLKNADEKMSQEAASKQPRKLQAVLNTLVYVTDEISQ